MVERFDFDALARELARGLSRREALRRLGGGFAGALLASLGLGAAWAKPGNGGGGSTFQKCSDYCNRLPRPQRSNCNNACKQCGGHYENVCASLNSTAVTCCDPGACCINGQCTPTDLSISKEHCGACGNHCAGETICVSGTCQCPQGENLCPNSTTCCPVNQACCGEVCCGLNETCGEDGRCHCGLGDACGSGLTCCGGNCVNTQTSILNCGACTNRCLRATRCAGGVCLCGDDPACPEGVGCVTPGDGSPSFCEA